MSGNGATPVVVLSGHTMALGVVRALGEAGIPVFVFHYDARDMAHVSRHVRGELAVPPPQTREDEFIEALLGHAGRFRGAMLLPASDESAVAVSRHKPLLAEHYLVACTDWEITRNFIEKRRTYELAARAGVATPETSVPSTVEEARTFARRIGFPLLVKPSQSHVYFEHFKRKMSRVRNDAGLSERVGEALRAGVEVMLQEIIPGPDCEVVNYNAYVCEGRSLVEFTARQVRKAPPHLGSPRVAVSERIPAVIEPGRATLRALGFDGFACSEFKRDPRDGRYKIVDVNGRHNLSGLLAVRCGINFPLIHYRHLVHGEIPEPVDFTPGVYWVDAFRDVAYGARYLLHERQAPWRHLAPYLSTHCDAIIAGDDLRPALARARYLAASPLRALAAAARRKRRNGAPGVDRAGAEGRAPGVAGTSEPRCVPAVVHVMTIPVSLFFLAGQAAAVRRAGFEVHAVASPGRALQAFGEREGVAIHGVPMTRAITPAQDLRALWRLWRTLRRLRPQIVHAHTPKGGLLGMLAAWLSGTPVRIYHMRGLPFVTASGFRRPLLRAVERLSCALAHRVLAISHSTRAIAVQEGICAAGKIRVLLGGGNGVDATDRFVPKDESIRSSTRARHGIPPDALVVGFVGRLAHDKGIVELARAWVRIRETDPRLHLLLVGPLEEENAVPADVIAGLRGDPRVHLTGLDWETPPLYAAMDVVALPTYREGFPNVPLEAAAMALPVVATKVPGCVDAVQDGVTGTLVPARDAGALASALLGYLSDPALRARHGEAGRRRVLAEFRREAISQAVADEYRSLLDSTRASPGERPTRDAARGPARGGDGEW